MANEMLHTEDSVDIQQTIHELRVEHERLQERLDELDTMVWLTPEEEMERKNCQKLKLLKKDRIHSLKKKLAS